MRCQLFSRRPGWSSIGPHGVGVVSSGTNLRHCAAKGSRHGRITWPQRGPVIGLQNGQIEHISLNFLRTVCGLRGVAPLLTCTNASIQTLKRNSTTLRDRIT